MFFYQLETEKGHLNFAPSLGTGDSPGLPVKREPIERKETLSKRVKAIFQGGRRSGPPVEE